MFNKREWEWETYRRGFLTKSEIDEEHTDVEQNDITSNCTKPVT